MSSDVNVRHMLRNVELVVKHPSTASDGDTVKLSYALRSEDKANLPDRITVSFEINMGSQTLTLRNSFTSLPIESSFEVGPLTSTVKILTNVALHFKDQTLKHSLTSKVAVRKFSPEVDSLDSVGPKSARKVRILSYALILCIVISVVFLVRGIPYFLDDDLRSAEVSAGYAYYSLFVAVAIFLARLYLIKKHEGSIATGGLATNIKE